MSPEAATGGAEPAVTAPRAVLLDIEGTTTSLSFVHGVLFPHSRARLRSFVRERADDERVRACLAAVRSELERETGRDPGDEGAVETLEGWIDADRKHPALKQLQGMIWREGWESGSFKSHVYDDVPRALRRWKERGLLLAVFSSGSIEAQQLLFRHAEAGDLTPLLSAYFDPTTAGPKREAESYRRIAAALELEPAEVLFLSDVEAELEAAQSAGMLTTRVVRPGTPEGSRHPSAQSFDEIAALG